ncbi:MAG: hypothetical protein SPG10_07645 [Enterocloster clostridioformis]|nr:hypothetical protein [Enterocloster clostridioformis]
MAAFPAQFVIGDTVAVIQEESQFLPAFFTYSRHLLFPPFYCHVSVSFLSVFPSVCPLKKSGNHLVRGSCLSLICCFPVRFRDLLPSKMQAAFKAFKKEALQRKRAIKTEKASPKEFTGWLLQQSNIILDLAEH